METRVAFGSNTLPQISDMGLFVVEKPWLHYDRNIEIDTLLFVIEGCVNVCEVGIDYEVKEGDVFFLKLNLRHWGKKLTPAGSKWFWICFHPFPSDQVDTNFWLPKQMTIWNPKGFKHRLAAMLEMFNSNSQYKNQVLNSDLYRLLIDIMRQQSKEESKTHTKIIADDITKLLQDNVEKNFSSEYIAHAMNMNYSYLCRVFKQEIGTTINRYYTELKIQKAIELLKSTDLNIAQISDRLNFPNPYYFSRVFKKVTGVAPSDQKNHMYR